MSIIIHWETDGFAHRAEFDNTTFNEIIAKRRSIVLLPIYLYTKYNTVEFHNVRSNGKSVIYIVSNKKK